MSICVYNRSEGLSKSFEVYEVYKVKNHKSSATKKEKHNGGSMRKFSVISILIFSLLLFGCSNPKVDEKNQPSPQDDKKTDIQKHEQSTPKDEANKDQESADKKADKVNTPVKIESLKLGFVPFMDSDIIITGTKNLPTLLKEELLKHGYEVGDITIDVATSYTATGEGMSAGSIDIAWLPSGTYAVYANDVEVLLSATRTGLSNDSENPIDWNGPDKITKKNGPEVTYYRSLICATPSKYGKELAKKVNSGEKLTLEDLSKAKWGIQSSTSASGHIYPTLWLYQNFGKKISELPNVVPLESGYGTAFLMAASEQVDIITFYADARIDYEKAWNLAATESDEKGRQGMGREASIWDEIHVIGVSKGIYNPAIAISKHSKAYSEDFKSAFQNAVLTISKTEEGKEIFGTFNHKGYQITTDADYESAKEVLNLVSE